jgi:hypothetical protein
MKRFLLDAFVKPGVAILFFLGFGLPFVFFGFQSVDLHGLRKTEGQTSFTIARKHFWGIVKTERTVAHVERAATATSDTGTGTDRRVLQSAVLVAGSQETPVFMGASNVDDRLKKRLVTEVNTFIQDSSQTDYAGTFRIRNVFGWVGLPFAAIGLFGLLGWPHTIISKWREHRKT